MAKGRSFDDLRKLWLNQLAHERRASPHTVASYGRDLAGFRLKSDDTRGETIDGGGDLGSWRRRRGLDWRPAQHPADTDHQRSRNRTGDRGDDPGRDRRGYRLSFR